MDYIFITDLRVSTRIGIYAWEQQVPQMLSFDIEIALAGSVAAASDAIEDTIDYAAVVGRIRESLSGNHFSLLEKLADHVAGLIINEFRAPWTKVRVAKITPLKGVQRLGLVVERGTRPG
jgi:dihydroneopterin aldolase